MENAKELLLSYVELAEKIIIEFNYNEENAISLLKTLKGSLEKKVTLKEEEKELYGACVYNALATINTSFEQEKKSSASYGSGRGKGRNEGNYGAFVVGYLFFAPEI